jgi:uncharacterized protein YndB with AHSA1/START domain
MSDQEFTITREFDAPRELVWKAWTDCAYFSQWWGPTEFTTSHCTIDARPGGDWISAMRSPEGHDFWSSGTFVELDAPWRFVVDEGFSDENGGRVTPQEYGMTDDMPAEDRITVTMEERDGRTQLTMVQGIPRDVAERNGAPEGWAQSLDKLEVYLRELQRGGRTVH